MITLTLPFPPSVNGYWRNINGRTLISVRGRAYKRVVARLVQWNEAAKRLQGRLTVQVVLHPPDRRKRDIDNSMKALLDAMQEAGVYLDDSQIDRLVIERGEVEKGGVAVITIKEIDAAENPPKH
jgi:crossover junction endodeoxyribonuclease RusA